MTILAGEDVQARNDAALAKADGAPLPDHEWWEMEAGVWMFDPADNNLT